MTMKVSEHKMTFNVTKEMHAQIKILAAKRFITIRTLMLRALDKYIAEEEKFNL